MGEHRIIQDGLVVVSTFGNKSEEQIGAYAAIYAEEGELTIQEKINGRWKSIATVNRDTHHT